MQRCSQCRYPVIENMQTCPNCGSEIAGKNIELIACPSCGAEVNANLDYCTECGKSLYEADQEYDYNTTSSEVEVIPVCTLSPITLVGEKKMSTKIFEDEGEGVSLARGNTAPNDQSIDEELQAHLFFYEGNWYVEEGVEDRRSTYVHAGKGIKLAPGDIIRLGDREFEFNIKTK